MSGYSAEFNTPSIHASDAVNLIHSEVYIDAPASVVFRTIRNTETWKDWNRFVPKVNITYQPPEEDSATAEEINQIVRNTSIIGSFYSDLTDGGGARPRSPDEQPPPRFRLNSISSQMSTDSNQQRRSGSIDQTHRASVTSVGSDGSKKSGAQLFQEATASRRASLANGDEPAAVNNNLVENTTNHRASLAVPAPSSPSFKRKASKKPKYTQVVTPGGLAMQKAQQALLTVYGEPSVRLQIKTKMTFYVRMKAASPSEYTETNMVVTEIARPDDPVLEKGTTALTRSKTHTLERTGKYRIVWATDSEGASLLNFTDVFKGSKLPKYMMQAERVSEIVATSENTCIYKTWELQKGHAAKSVKKKHGEHLQKMFEVWASGLKEFCEGLHAPKVAVRDFSVVEEHPVVIQTLT